MLQYESLPPLLSTRLTQAGCTLCATATHTGRLSDQAVEDAERE